MRASLPDLEPFYPGLTSGQIAHAIMKLGPAMVLLTDEDRLAHAYSRAGNASRPVEPVQVIDTVGAGDTFVAAALWWLAGRSIVSREQIALLQGNELQDLLSKAMGAAALTCQRKGADPPWRGEMAGL